MVYVLIVIGLLLAIVLIWMALMDGSYFITRSIHLDVSREKAFNLISDFKTWTEWSPWLCVEPQAKVVISNNGTGIGAIYKWDGEIIGAGEIEHKRMTDYMYLEQEIRFIKPFKSKSHIFWKFEGKGEVCHLTWGMKGKMPFPLQFMAKKLEPLIGMDYERGLKMIKDKVELETVPSKVEINGIDYFNECSFIGIRTNCLKHDISDSIKTCLKKINNHLSENSKPPKSALSIYHNFDLYNTELQHSTGFIADTITPLLKDDFYQGNLVQRKAVKITFNGDYKHLPNAWFAAYHYAKKKRYRINKKHDPVEFYLNTPETETNPSNLITEVYLPIN